MRTSKLVGFVLAITGLVGCASEIRYHHEFGPAVPYTGFGKGYIWMGSIGRLTGSPRLDNQSFRDFLKEAITDEFTRKGYEFREEGEPDFRVNYFVSTKIMMEADPSFNVQQFEEGSLVIDVVAVDSAQLMWRGTAAAKINDQSGPEERRTRLRTAIQGVLSNFPSQPGSVAEAEDKK